MSEETVENQEGKVKQETQDATPTAEDLAVAKLRGEKTQEPSPEDKKEPPVTLEKKPEEANENPEEEGKFFEKYTAGKIKSKTEFDAFFGEVDTHKKTIEELTSKNSRLEEKIKGNPFGANEELFRLSKLSEKLETKDYGMLARLNPETMKDLSDIEVMKLKMVLDNPSFRDNQAVLDRRLGKKYSVAKPENLDDLDPDEKANYDLEVKDKEFELKEDAKKIRKELSALWNDVDLPKQKTEDELKAENDKLVVDIANEWTPAIKDTDASLKKMEFNIPVDKGEFKVSVDVPENMKKEVERILNASLGYVFNGRMKATPENVESVKSFAVKSFIAENFPYIMGEVVRKFSELSEQERMKIYHNSSALNKHQDPPKQNELTAEQKRTAELQQGK